MVWALHRFFGKIQAPEYHPRCADIVVTLSCAAQVPPGRVPAEECPYNNHQAQTGCRATRPSLSRTCKSPMLHYRSFGAQLYRIYFIAYTLSHIQGELAFNVCAVCNVAVRRRLYVWCVRAKPLKLRYQLQSINRCRVQVPRLWTRWSYRLLERLVPRVCALSEVSISVHVYVHVDVWL